MEEIGRDDVGVQREARPVGAGARELLDHDGAVQKGAAQSAVFLRYGAAEDPSLAGAPPRIAGHHAGLLPLSMVRRDLGFDEAADRPAEHLVFLVEYISFDHDALLRLANPNPNAVSGPDSTSACALPNLPLA